VTTVVLLDPRLGPVLPAAALPALRAATAVHATADVPPGTGVDPAPADLAPGAGVVLLACSADDPVAAALIDAGAEVIGTPAPAGAELLAAVAVMDRLRSPGGCPWDAEQTHDSLRQYLVEETFELLEAIEDGDRPALREELGDVLLQVLFHARVAAEDAGDPFGVDEVAAELVAKLVGRHPHVFSGGDPAVSDAASQEVRWEELKQVEKRRESSVDGVALGQPAVALAAKLTSRTARAGLPADLLPGIPSTAPEDPAVALFGITAAAKLAGVEPEGGLRAVGRAFAAAVRAAERAARADGADPAALTAEQWRGYWPAS
jgi:XTP/dITP diphosphohydrolase